MESHTIVSIKMPNLALFYACLHRPYFSPHSVWVIRSPSKMYINKIEKNQVKVLAHKTRQSSSPSRVPAPIPVDIHLMPRCSIRLSSPTGDRSRRGTCPWGQRRAHPISLPRTKKRQNRHHQHVSNNRTIEHWNLYRTIPCRIIPSVFAQFHEVATPDFTCA